MFRGPLFVRYSTYFFGIFITALNIFLLTYFLDVNEFSVWGISMSLIYVLSQLGQLTYVQYVDKYFPNISYQEMKNKLYRFIKTIFLFSPIWFLILEFLKIIGYFQKFKIENIENLFLMLVALIILESSIEVVSKFMLASKNTKNYDISELFILKILRVVSFYLLLINNYSIFHLLFVSVLIRGSFLIYIIFLVEKSIIKIIKNIFFANIFFDNFQNFKYTLYAFLIKTFQISFLNLIFLIYTRNSVSETIAAFSLGVIIVNNVRPIISSLSSLMTPSLSEKAKKKEIASEYLVKSSFLNTLIASFFIVGILIFVEFKGLYEMYFLEFDNYVYTIAIVSVFASTINPIYTPAFIFIKFSKKLIF